MPDQMKSGILAPEAGVLRLDQRPSGEHRLLMFSGGRDSTLAAVRMARDSVPMALVTVSSSHLVGIERVKARLSELARLVGRPHALAARAPTN